MEKSLITLSMRLLIEIAESVVQSTIPMPH
jgi:hypothetical protein